MTKHAAVRKSDVERKTKVKTGCKTCRVRKIKCDERKPFCQKCVRTGRTCDGYETPFRSCNTPLTHLDHTDGVETDVPPCSPRTMPTYIAAEDIDLLNRYFSTKTIFGVKISCDREARQTLQASLTDPLVRYAVLSLKALREDFESSTDFRMSVVQRTPQYNYGVQQYSMALGGLASKLSSPGSDELKSALLCCRIFISIEQVQGNFSAMGHHMIQGLRIMHEYRARPEINTARELVSAHYAQLPLLDVFIIKQFAAPCKFTCPLATDDMDETPIPGRPPSSLQVQEDHRNLRIIAPNLRTGLLKIAASTLGFLSRVLSVETAEAALHLLSEKASLLKSLESWLTGLNIAQTGSESLVNEAIPVSFMRLNHAALKVILLGALESSPDVETELQIENDRMQGIANTIGERLKAYKRY